MKFVYQKIFMTIKKNNEDKIQIFWKFVHFTPTPAEKHHIKRSYFYRKHYSEQNKTNLKSLSQKLKEESAFEVEKRRFSGEPFYWRSLMINLPNIKTRPPILGHLHSPFMYNIFTHDQGPYNACFSAIKKFLIFFQILVRHSP